MNYLCSFLSFLLCCHSVVAGYDTKELSLCEKASVVGYAALSGAEIVSLLVCLIEERALMKDVHRIEAVATLSVVAALGYQAYVDAGACYQRRIQQKELSLKEGNKDTLARLFGLSEGLAKGAGGVSLLLGICLGINSLSVFASDKPIKRDTIYMAFAAQALLRTGYRWWGA